MPTLRELRDQRAAAWTQACEYNRRDAAGEQLSGDDETGWQRALAEVDRLGDLITTRERNASLESSFADIDQQTRGGDGQPSDGTGGAAAGGDGGSIDDYREAFRGFMRYGLDQLEPEQRQLIRGGFRADPELRAQGVATGAGGGYMVPEGFWAKVTETMKFFGGVIESGVELLDTDTGVDIPWPTNDDTGNKGALLSENTQITEQDLSMGGKTLGAYMYTSKLVRVSLQLIQDSAIDVENFIARKLGERLGRILNEHWTTGDAANKPQGCITGATVGKTTAGATAITYNEIIDLIHSVDAAYRSDAAFQLHDLVLAYVRKIRDDSGGAGLGRPIWEPSMQAGVPDLILGYRYAVNNDMASSIATTNKTMGFGNWRAAYVARRVNGAQLMRLAERYADFLQVGFFGFQRADGITQDPSAAKVLQQA